MSIRKHNSIFLENKTSVKIDESSFYCVWETIVKKEKLNKNAKVNILLVNDKIIRGYNKKYLGRDEPTDVIVFSTEIPQIHFLGDIIIDTEQAEKQKDSRTLNVELQRLFLHGLLHLLGYDHISAAQKKNMTSKENEYWKLIKGEI